MVAKDLQVFSESFQHQYEREGFAFYAVGVLVVLLRFYARIRRLGIRGLQLDDFLAGLALCFYTLLIVCLYLTATGGGSALAFPGQDVMSFPPAQIKAQAKGAKIDLLAEVGMLNTIWVLKACMLLLYYRLSNGLPTRQLIIKAIGIYCVVGWIAIELAFFLQCRPFSNYWQIAPSPSLNCMTLYDYAIVQCTFNISSDVMMLLVPLPMILKSSVPVKQKAVLGVIFSMGIFVIAAALCTKIEFFTDVYSASYMFWYTREASVAMYVANLPCIWPLFREMIPVLRSWSPGASSSNRTSKKTGTGPTGIMSRVRGTLMSRADNDDEYANKSHAQPTIVEMEEGKGWGSKSRDSDEEVLQGRIRADTTIEMTTMEHGESDDETTIGHRFDIV